MNLDELINPRHLRAEAIRDARWRLRADRFASVVVDDFLQPSLISGLLSCFERDGDFRPHHSLKRLVMDDEPVYEERYVSAEEFENSPEDRRLARELLMADQPPADTGSEGWSAHLRFMEMSASAVFQTYLGAITDATGLGDVTYMARTMRHGDLCSAHSDAGDGRKLCMLLYVGGGWKPGFGGRFQNLDALDVARNTEPLGNRMILHKPAPDQIHQVEPFGDAGRLWRRHSYSVWFGTFPEVG